MSVPKGRRKESQFEVIHLFYKITDLLLRDFGYNQKKAESSIMSKKAKAEYG